MMFLKMIVSALTFYSVDSQMALIGGIQDSHGCVTDGGYQWCEHTQSCIRPWTTPCEEVVQAPIPPPVPGSAPSPAPLCSGILCMMYCEHGHELDDHGCPMCQCRVEPVIENTLDSSGHRRTQDMPPIAIDPMPPVVDPGFGVDTSVGVSEGGRCASGFCENAADCPQCQAGLTCVVPADMMCAGTCYGTCHAPPSVLPTPAPTPSAPINPDCVVWNDGCNTCQVRNGNMVGCTRMMCFHQGTPHCLVYGHH